MLKTNVALRKLFGQCISLSKSNLLGPQITVEVLMKGHLLVQPAKLGLSMMRCFEIIKSASKIPRDWFDMACVPV